VVVVALVDVAVDDGVDDEAGAEELPPQPTRSNAAATPSTASRLIFRFMKYCVTMTIPFCMNCSYPFQGSSFIIFGRYGTKYYGTGPNICNNKQARSFSQIFSISSNIIGLAPPLISSIFGGLFHKYLAKPCLLSEIFGLAILVMSKCAVHLYTMIEVFEQCCQSYQNGYGFTSKFAIRWIVLQIQMTPPGSVLSVGQSDHYRPAGFAVPYHPEWEASRVVRAGWASS
jgi:hypothetical protein